MKMVHIYIFGILLTSQDHFNLQTLSKVKLQDIFLYNFVQVLNSKSNVEPTSTKFDTRLCTFVAAKPFEDV